MKQNKSKFNLSNEVKTTFNIGELIPFFWRETLPGDIFRNNTNTLIRLLPLKAPLMHKVELFQYFYFVPYRILSDSFRTMITKPLDESAKFVSLYDYLRKLGMIRKLDSLDNLPLLKAFGINSLNGYLTEEAAKSINMMPFFAYYLIYNYFYLDPVINANTYIDDFKPDDFFKFNDILDIRIVNKYGDYFTKAKPNTQYGNEISLDLNSDGVIKVRELRTAERIQVWFEKLLNNYENKYNKTLKGLYGVSPSDNTLQRPLYLGGDKTLLDISDVPTTADYGNEPLGYTAGRSVTYNNRGSNFRFEPQEHGLILGLAYILPRQNYIQGIPREFQRITAEDIHNPLFNNIGMQELKGNELDANRTDTFGYVDRYHEFKNSKDVITGDFTKPNYTFWHLGMDIRQSVLSPYFLKYKQNSNPFIVSTENNSTNTSSIEDFTSLNFIPDTSYAVVRIPNSTNEYNVAIYDDRNLEASLQNNIIETFETSSVNEILVLYISDGSLDIIEIEEFNSNYHIPIIPGLFDDDIPKFNMSELRAGDGRIIYTFDYSKVYPGKVVAISESGTIQFDNTNSEIPWSEVLATFYNDCSAVRPLPAQMDTSNYHLI